ncbi:hypothetical protein FBUS_11843, partial [Fasciolopsis buskii]
MWTVSDLNELNSYLAERLKINQDRLAHLRDILQIKCSVNRRLKATLQILQKDLQPPSSEALSQQQ